MHVLVEFVEHTIVVLLVVRVMRRFFKNLRLQLREQTNGVVLDLFPQIGVKATIERASLWMPTPPQVVCQLVEPTDAGGQCAQHCYEAKCFDRHTVWNLLSRLMACYTIYHALALDH